MHFVQAPLGHLVVSSPQHEHRLGHAVSSWVDYPRGDPQESAPH